MHYSRNTLSINHGPREGVYKFNDVTTPFAFPEGTMLFLPKQGEGYFRCGSGHFETTLVSLSDDAFIKAASDFIDHDRIRFRLTEVCSPALASLLAAVRMASSAPDFNHWPLLVESCAIAITVALIRELSPEASTACDRLRPGLSAEKKRRVLEYIDANIHRPLTIAELADKAAMSRFHFMRSFRGSVGETPMRYVGRRRLEAAKLQLRASNEPIARVALSAGYSSQSHMATAFKALTGMTPGQFRQAAKCFLIFVAAPWLHIAESVLKLA